MGCDFRFQGLRGLGLAKAVSDVGFVLTGNEFGFGFGLTRLGSSFHVSMEEGTRARHVPCSAQFWVSALNPISSVLSPACMPHALSCLAAQVSQNGNCTSG